MKKLYHLLTVLLTLLLVWRLLTTILMMSPCIFTLNIYLMLLYQYVFWHLALFLLFLGIKILMLELNVAVCLLLKEIYILLDVLLFFCLGLWLLFSIVALILVRGLSTINFVLLFFNSLIFMSFCLSLTYFLSFLVHSENVLNMLSTTTLMLKYEDNSLFLIFIKL